MPVDVIGRIVPKSLQGDVVLYESKEASGTQRTALSIGVRYKLVKKKLPSMAVGISHIMDLRYEQPAKHDSPKLVTDSGMVMVGRDLQEQYLEVIYYQLFAVITVEKWIGRYLWVDGK